MISPATIQEITSRIEIIDVVGEFVKLKKRGTNYLGNCPFHNEKTPSFTVSPVKEIYKCFGCGKSGNTITFLMEHEKISYVEALRWLAARYHITIEETATSPEQKIQIQTADSLYIINQFAQKFFSDQLNNTEEGVNIALSYLKERGFQQQTIDKFQIGYSPSAKDSLTKALLANQFNKELLPKTGLVSVRNQDEFQDNYRGRIIFPIHGITGKIIGFGARIIGKSEKSPKYINTPENDVYSKSKILYGAYFAKSAIDKANECLLVEGYTDVVSLQQAGIENVVASGGTSLTIDQLRLIKKYTNNLTIIYDGDSAGIKAALRGLDMALEESLNVQLVLIPDGEDPDSYVHKVGSTAFNLFVATAKKDFVLFQLEVMLQEAGKDLNKKSAVVNHIAETLSKINRSEDFTKLQDYIRQCSQLLKIDEGGLTNLVNKYKRDKIVKEEKRLTIDETNQLLQTHQEQDHSEFEPIALLSQDQVQEKNMLKVLLTYGLNPWNETSSMADYVFHELEQFQFDQPELNELFEEYRSWYVQGKEPSFKNLVYHPNEKLRELVISLNITEHELSQNWDTVLPNMNIVNRDTSHEDVTTSVHFFKLKKIKKMFEQNQQDMENASYEEQIKLMEVHKSLKEIEREITKKIGTVIIK